MADDKCPKCGCNDMVEGRGERWCPCCNTDFAISLLRRDLTAAREALAEAERERDLATKGIELSAAQIALTAKEGGVERLRLGLARAGDAVLCFSHYNWCDDNNECFPECADLARERGDKLADAIKLFLDDDSIEKLWDAECRVKDEKPKLPPCPAIQANTTLRNERDRLRGLLIKVPAYGSHDRTCPPSGKDAECMCGWKQLCAAARQAAAGDGEKEPEDGH